MRYLVFILYNIVSSFIGVRNPQSAGPDVMREMDEVCYDKVHQFVSKGHQVLVFVTARNATTKLAITFRDEATKKVFFYLFRISVNLLLYYIQ